MGDYLDWGEGADKCVEGVVFGGGISLGGGGGVGVGFCAGWAGDGEVV